MIMMMMNSKWINNDEVSFLFFVTVVVAFLSGVIWLIPNLDYYPSLPPFDFIHTHVTATRSMYVMAASTVNSQQPTSWTFCLCGRSSVIGRRPP